MKNGVGRGDEREMGLRGVSKNKISNTKILSERLLGSGCAATKWGWLVVAVGAGGWSCFGHSGTVRYYASSP